MAEEHSANPKRRPGRPRKGTAMQVVTEPEQSLLPEQIKAQILAGAAGNDAEALRFQAETVARFSDESLLRHEINIYQLAGLSAEVIEVLKGNRASQPLIRIFEEHSRIVIRLRSKIARLQGKFMYRLEPYWAVPEKSLEALLAGFNEIDAQIESEKKLLIADYEKHYTQFLETIAGIAHAQSGDIDQALNVLRIYAERFPEPAEIQSNFRLAILEPTRLPSMQEQAQRDAAVMSALAETKRAQAEYDAAQSLERMQERTAQEMQRLMQQLCLNVQEELYGAMAEVLGQLETLTKGKGKANLSATKQAAIEEALESLAKLGELGVNPLNGIASQMESLYQQQVAKLGRDASKGTKSQAQQELKTRIQTIKQELEAQLPEDLSSAGNRKLWEWLRA